MKHDPTEIKRGLHALANESEVIAPSWVIRQHKETAIDALAYIRHLEGELRRQGFTDYQEKEEQND